MEIPKLSVILISGELEKLHAGCLVSSVAAVSGMEVNVFVTMDALNCFRKDAIAQRDFKCGQIGLAMLTKNVDLFYQLLANAKEMGSCNVFGCAMAMDLMEWNQDEMSELFDEVIGVTAFLGKAQGSQLMVF